jgi:predicted ATPase/DNA-binding SARP family transcriptional activator
VDKAVAKAGLIRPPRVKTRGHLDVRLFGHLEVALDGERVALATPRKSLQVLAYLLLNRSSAVSREYLAFLLYPDDDEGSARAKLRATLSELAKVLPQPVERYVTIDTDKVALNPAASVWIDVEAFEQDAGDPNRLAEAIDLYRGDLLPEVYDEWLDVIRERLRDAYLRCLTDRVSEARRNANLALAIDTARRILAVDPWREDVVRRLVTMRYESGDRAGALSEYAAFAKRLREELDAEPMPETAAVAERIARGEAPEDEERDVERGPGAAGLFPFVGRRDEMERLLETWNRVVRGRGACVFVSGEAGIGKSRLVAELARTVEERGGRVLSGATSSPETVPYESFVDALRFALPLVAALKPSIALAGVATLLPELHARVDLPALPRLDAENERVRLFESLFRCIADLASARPLLLVLEDLHWAQTASIELLRFLLRRVAGAPVMVVVTYRDEETVRLNALHRLRRDARTITNVQNVALGGLGAGDVRELGAALPQIQGRSIEGLVAASQGNPLFLMQLVADARETEPIGAPASLREVVARRIERLSAGARTIAEIAACVGDRFSREAVREVSAWDEPSLTDALDELLDRRIIREAAGRGVLEYEFAHNLVQQAIVSAVPGADAAVRRRRVARVLEELYPDRFSELSAALAGHYDVAGDAPNAARCYLEAVRRSVRIGALEEARSLCDRALALALATHSRTAFLFELVTIESRRGDAESRRAALSALEHTDRELGDPEVHRKTLLQRIEFAAAAADLESQAAAVRELSDCVPESDARWKAAAHLAAAKLDFTAGELVRARRAGEVALASSRAAGDEAGCVSALCILARIDVNRGNMTSAYESIDEAAQVAAGASDPVLELQAVSSGLIAAYQERDLDRCRALAERCLELSVQLGDRYSEARALTRLAISLSLSDEHVAEARRHFAAAARVCRECGDNVGTAAQLMSQSVLEARLGFFGRAAEATEKAIELFDRAGDARGRLGALSNLAFIKASTGDATAARAAADSALRDAARLGFGVLEASILENLASAEAAAGNFERAIELAQTSFDVRSRSESEVSSAKTLGDIVIWHARCGDLAAARDAVTRLLADEAAIARGADWPSYCYWCAAQILHLSGETTGAKRALERARRIMESSAKALEPEDRASFLNLAFHRDITAVAGGGAWPDPPR